jgi:hypothetical protein
VSPLTASPNGLAPFKTSELIMTKDDTVKSVNVLAGWLFNRLDSAEPRIRVTQSLGGAIRAVVHELQTCKTINARPAYYSEIMNSIMWSVSPPDAPLCGLKSLLFLGELTEAAYKYDVAKISIDRAVEMLIDCWDERGLLFHLSGDRCRIISTPEFEQRCGFSVRVRLKSVTEHADAVWQLDDLAHGAC